MSQELNPAAQYAAETETTLHAYLAAHREERWRSVRRGRRGQYAFLSGQNLLKPMKKRFLLLLALLPINLLAAERLPDAEARRVLERVAHASQMSDFQGVYLQQHGEHTETIRVFHVVENGVVHERREVLYGPAREMVRHGSQVSLYLPEGARPVQLDPR